MTFLLNFLCPPMQRYDLICIRLSGTATCSGAGACSSSQFPSSWVEPAAPRGQSPGHVWLVLCPRWDLGCKPTPVGSEKIKQLNDKFLYQPGEVEILSPSSHLSSYEKFN